MLEFLAGLIVGAILTIVVLIALAYESFKKDDEDFWNR